MRRSPLLAFTFLALISSTTIVRGDQPPDAPKANHKDKVKDFLAQK